VEEDGLLRLLVEQAVLALGVSFGPLAGAAPAGPAAATLGGAGPAAAQAVVFVGLERPEACFRAAGGADRDLGGAALVVGYAARAAPLLGAHRLHGCCDAFLELRPGPGGAVFAHPPATSAVERAGLTAREADVLLLLAAGLTTAEVGARLRVSPATARCHCRAVLRKLGAADRRSLRAALRSGEGAAVAPGAPPRERPPGRQPSSSKTSPVSSLG